MSLAGDDGEFSGVEYIQQSGRGRNIPSTSLYKEIGK